MKHQILLKILELTQSQSIALEEENIELFNELMNQKQLLIDNLQDLHTVNPETQTERYEELQKQIITLDTANNQEFHRQFEKVQKSLRKIRSQKRVDTVYSNPYDISQEEGLFFDKR